MSSLKEIIVFTSNVDEMRRFYEGGIGLAAGHAGPGRWTFDTARARLALHAVRDSEEREIELGLETVALEAAIGRLRARGVVVGELRSGAGGRWVRLRDDEGNRLSLREATAAPRGGAGGGADRTPAVATVIVNCADLLAAMVFYRDRLGLKVASEAPHWVELDTGATRLALHTRPSGQNHPLHAAQRVAYCLESPDLDAWVDEMRARGLHFATAPIEEDFGLYAEALDPDGNIVVFREPRPAPPIEEELAEAFESDEVPHVVAIRKPVLKAARAVSRVALRPEYHETKAARPRPESEIEAPEPRPAVASVRGAGPEHARLKPRTSRDTKRAKAKPAIGRRRKAGREAQTRQQSAAATASRSKPVKRAAARGTRRT